MNIVIFGATSQIAKDLIISFSKRKKYNFILFTRHVTLLKKWINCTNLDGNYQYCEYSQFNKNSKYDVIINFVGIGDPKKLQDNECNILDITYQYDAMILDYLGSNKETKYIFLSSGAVFGGNFNQPVNEKTVATIDINNFSSTDWYAMAKLYAEARHRALLDLSIIDVRVFNYFSHRQSMAARFLITDIVRAMKSDEIFKTAPDNIVRDFLIPIDFYYLIQSIIDFRPVNLALDCYTNSPVKKYDLLAELEDKYGLKYKVEQSIDIINATGSKLNYYSVNKIAGSMGYKPINSSLEGIIKEVDVLLDTLLNCKAI
jgi:nucleoside-diphosphate-sugar epimerase